MNVEHALLQFPRLRSKLTFLCLAAFCVSACADVIYLKNGRRIAADSVHEVDGRVEYTIGDNTFAIPKSVVERIDTGPASSVPSGQPGPTPAELPKLPEHVETGEELVSRIIRNGEVDSAALKTIDDEGVPEKSAAANFVAGHFEEQRNHLNEAARYLSVAVGLMPNHLIILEHYVTVLLELGSFTEAVPFAERAVRGHPESGDALFLLGYAYYKTEHNAEAMAAWKKSLSLRPDPKVQAMLERVERESKTEADFRQQHSSHFVLRYEGSQAPETLRAGIVAALEDDYTALANELGAAPRAVSVSLYTQQEFFDVTQAAEWSAALNDGKLRIPVSGLTEVTPRLGRVLRHELTHSFVNEITHGHAPGWLNEGLAQVEEGRSTAPLGQRLAALYASGNQAPLNQLEHSFHNFSSEEAPVAYAESLAAVEYIRGRYGMSDVARILQRLGAGETVESALRNTIHGGYAQLESEIADYLKRSYGQ